MANLHCTESEIQSVEARYSDDYGVNYAGFLDEIEPPEIQPRRFVERMKDIRLANSKKRIPERNPIKDLDSVLLKIKTKIFRERVRSLEFLTDYDKLKCGRILKTQFRRALDMCRLDLLESEVAMLEDHYQCAQDCKYVDYLRYNDDIESIFTTKHLEKTPTREVHLFHPPDEINMNELVQDKTVILQICLQRIADRVREVRVQLFPLFNDYDRVHNGTVTRQQFRRVLSELQIGDRVATETEWICLFEKFNSKVGGTDNFNYLTFCDVVHGMAGFNFRRP